MPIYVMECTQCDWSGETIQRSWKEENWDPCEECEGKLIKSDTVENLMISDYSNFWAAGRQYVEGGEVFHSAKERHDYEEKFSISAVVDPGSPKHKALKDEARWEADVAARDAGYKDHGDFRKEKRYEKALNKGQLSSGEKKVTV